MFRRMVYPDQAGGAVVEVRKTSQVTVLFEFPIEPDAATVGGLPDALRHEVRFPPAREGHRMVGSGMFVVNAPFGLAQEAARLDAKFARL